jgi:beta-glucosidase
MIIIIANPYKELILSGKVGTKELDDKVRRLLRLAFHTTLNKNRPLGSVASSEHIDAARKIGEEGIVLFKIKTELYQLI